MKLLTDRLHEPLRSMVRFCVVGTTGMGIQYGWYYLFLYLFHTFFPEHDLVSVAFTIGFVLEMISNYIFSSYYTFSSKPDWKNAGGFLVGRGINYVVQMGFLWLLIHPFHIGEKAAGILAILLASIINYFVLRFFFKSPKS